MACIKYQQGRRAAYVCIGDDEDPQTYSRAIPGVTCPNEAEHTPGPRGYTARFEWATRMAKTHTQTLCSGCDRWAIWVPG